MGIKRILVLMIALMAVLSIPIYFLYVNFIAPVNVTIPDLFSNPSRYDGREVRVEGLLLKTWFINTLFHNLTDAGYGVAVSSSADTDLDAYVGLKILVQGKFRYYPKLPDAPSLQIEVSTIHIEKGEPHFFLQFERIGGIAGFQEVFLLDNNATASLLSRGVIIWRKQLSPEEYQEITHIVLDSGFLSLEEDAYDPKEGVADFFAYRLKVIIASDMKLQSKALSWVDEWASKEPLPSNLTRLMAELRAFIASIYG